MRCSFLARCVAVVALVAPAASAGDAPATAKRPVTPVASAVVVRGRTTLSDAVRACLARAPKGEPTAPIAVVLDVTEETKKAAADLSSALAEAASLPEGKGPWQVGALGAPLSAPSADPAAVGRAVTAAMEHPGDDGPDTLGRLRASLRGSTAKVVIYVAHDRFEDAVDLEGFIAESLAAGRTFSVIGPEAAFERPWSDVVSEGAPRRPGRGLDYSIPGVGSSPFEPDDPAAPWHSGDTAYPLVPWHFGGKWDMEFTAPRSSLRDSGKMADLMGKLKGYWEPPDAQVDDPTFYRWARQHVVPPDVEKDPEAFRAWRRALGPPPDRRKDPNAALDWMTRLRRSAPRASGESPVSESFRDVVGDSAPPRSGFGPYGLMRAAGATGGCYVLWRWAGEPDDVGYDYARCDALGPDLRARAEIFADVVTRPRARALMRAWTLMSTSRPGICVRTVPMWADEPASIVYQPSVIPIPRFSTPDARDRRVTEVVEFAARIARVRVALAADVAALSPAADPVDLRLQADVDLLLHALDSNRFQVNEFVGRARALGADAWSSGGAVTLDHAIFVDDGVGDGKRVEVRSVPLHDPAAGAALVEARKAFLARYGGTPFGAIVDRNIIWTYGPPRPGR